MTIHHILPRRILKTEIVTAKSSRLLLHEERLEVGHAEGGVEAEGRGDGSRRTDRRVEWLKTPIEVSLSVGE